MPTDRRAALVADIGGTNARFALVGPSGRVGTVTTKTVADHPTLLHAFRAYLDETDAAPKRAAVAIACPITGDKVRMTNHPWAFSISGLKRALALAQLRVVNDFEAIAHALPRLGARQKAAIGGGRAVAGQPIAVLGPGTGLGMAGMIQAPDGGWIALATEGGHATMPAFDEREANVLAVLRKRKGHVSAERVLSGPGLQNLYHAVAHLRGERSKSPPKPSQIVDMALGRSSPAAVEALDIFAAMLGTVAADFALSLGARGGVFLAGGIVPRLVDYLRGSPFRARFEDKGRFGGYLGAIPTWVVTAPDPALIGLAHLPAPGGNDGR